MVFVIVVISVISLTAEYLWRKGWIPKWTVVPFGICGFAFGLHLAYSRYNEIKYHPDPEVEGLIFYCTICFWCILAIYSYWGDFKDRWLSLPPER
tara:strand:- start:72 stop:356 length:285 start_codon:yes stop_codon:yes gene_type:complete